MDHTVIAHLEKYFRLAWDRLQNNDAPLAAFFALTAIEECGKLLILRDANLDNQEEKDRLLQHHEKYLVAAINLLDQNERLDAVGAEWREEVWSWIGDPKKAMRIRNDALYLRFHRDGHVSTPAVGIDGKQAALYVWLAGMALAELHQYYDGLTPEWAAGIHKAADDVWSRHLTR